MSPRVIWLIFIATLCFNSAHAQLQHKLHFNRKPTGNFWIDKFGVKRHPQTDTIGGKPAQFYLNNPEVKRIAKNFYRGKFRPSDNDSTTYMLSLVTTTNAVIRPFYRWCLNQTIAISDGALGEYPGEPALQYAIKYPKEFFDYMDQDTIRLRYRKWVEIIAYSGLPDYEMNMEATRKYLIKNLSANCRQCSVTYQREIKKFAHDVVKNLTR